MQDDAIKRQIIEDPSTVLEDLNVMQALIAAHAPVEGRNVVDLRGVLVARLEASLGRLETTHRDVVAAAYENLAGTNQIHRAALAIIDPQDFQSFLNAIANVLPDILAADGMHLCLEGPNTMAGQRLGPEGDLRSTVIGLPIGGVDAYCGSRATAKVILRPATKAAELIYGATSDKMRSEAVIRIDLGPDRLAGMLVIGSSDRFRFHPEQATDLLSFLGRVLMRRYGAGSPEPHVWHFGLNCRRPRAVAAVPVSGQSTWVFNRILGRDDRASRAGERHCARYACLDGAGAARWTFITVPVAAPLGSKVLLHVAWRRRRHRIACGRCDARPDAERASAPPCVG